MKSLKSNIWYNILPIFIQLIVTTVRGVISQFDFGGIHRIIDITADNITTLSEIILLLAFPIYLLIINIMYSIKQNKYMFIHRIIFMMIIVSVTRLISYLGWVISTRMLFESDDLTVDIAVLQLKITLSIIVVVGVIFQSIMFIKYLKLRQQLKVGFHN